jgi:hypothetical protein
MAISHALQDETFRIRDREKVGELGFVTHETVGWDTCNLKADSLLTCKDWKLYLPLPGVTGQL